MNEIFGLPMTGIMVALAIALFLCLLSVAWVAWRRPVIFKMGVRNIPRRRAQTTLILIGLMLSTLIIGVALGTGDTIDYSMKADVFNSYGEIDELIIASHDVEPDASLASGTTTFDASAFALVDQAVSGDANVEGIMPILNANMSAVHEAANLAEPDVTLIGLDPTRVDTFGGIARTGGETLDLSPLEPGEVVISEKMSAAMEANVGDTITVYFDNEPMTLTVAGVGENSYLTGVQRDINSGKETIGLAMPLEHLQTLTGQSEQLSAIAVSNAGDVRSGLDLTGQVVDALKPELVDTGLGVLDVKQAGVDTADETSSLFSALFMVLGLFSVAAGVLLIILIFTMLAAERRSEMGMARAVGTHRRQLVQQFVAEGAAYAVLAGLVGAALGVVTTYGIAFGLKAIFGDYVPIEAHVTWRSLVVAYCLGVVITFLTVVAASWKISRINIVAAVRDMPDVTTSRRKKSGLIWGGLLLLVGGLLTMSGASGDSAVAFMSGMSLLPFGVALIGRYFGIASRLLFSVTGLYLLVLWLIPERQSRQLWGELDSGMEMFFLSGIFMVIGTTIVIVNNTDILLGALASIGGLFRSKLPAIRTAVAYPGAARGRTGLTIAMFSLIIFSLVLIATMNQNFADLFTGDEAGAGWDVRADAHHVNPVVDFTEVLQAEGVDTSDFAAVGVTTSPGESGSQMRITGTEDWKTRPMIGMSDAFIQQSELTFERYARGYESDDAVLRALLTQPNVAVIDSFAVPSEGNVSTGDSLTLDSLQGEADVFEPVSIDVVDPDTGKITAVTVIGIIDGKISSLYGVYASQATIDDAYGDTMLASYFVALGSPENASEVAKSIESAALQSGVQATSIRDEIQEMQRQQSGFLYIIQGFMGLGLLVGIAAVGVISFRSVVERRQQIGVLRSLGYQRETVALSFMIETAFVVGMGILAGTSLGLMLSRNLLASEEFGSSGFTNVLIPWEILTVVIIGTMLVALLMTWIPARQATRIAPAEALRYE